LADWQKEEKLQHLFEEAIQDIQQKEPLEASIQTLIKANLTKNFGLDTNTQFFEPISFTSSTTFTDAIRSTLLVSQVLLKISMLLDLSKISNQLEKKIGCGGCYPTTIRE
jgi:flagellar motor switch protein FliG